MQKVIGVERLLFDDNVFELALFSSGTTPVAIHLVADASAYVGADYVYGDLIVRGNKIRYLDGRTDMVFIGYAADVSGVRNAVMTSNMVECIPANPIKTFHCGTATYFNNKSPAGALIQGYNGDTSTKYSELETEAEDALLLTLI